MKRMAPWLAALVLALSAGSLANAQQIKDSADLLPASTLAYLEVRHPDKLAQEMGLLVKGSSLEDIAATMAKFRAKMPKDEFWWTYSSIAEMGLVVSPEILNEFSRMHGGTLALTGVSKDKGPVWVGIVNPGESNFPSFYMRAFLASSSMAKPVGETEGVMIYSQRNYVYEPTPKPQPGEPYREPQRREEAGIAMAMMPGMLIFGATPDQVKDVIRRAKGKSSDPSLSSLRAFKDAAKLRDRPGLFAYADLDALAAQMDEAAKTMRPNDKLAWEQFKTVVNPRAFRAGIASLTIQNGNLELTAQIKTVSGQNSPLLDLLPDKKTDPQIFQYVPRDSLVTMNLAAGDGEKRWTKLVAMFDALAKNAGETEMPSKKIKDAQDELKIDYGKDVFGRVKGGAVCVVPSSKNAAAPLLVIQATDATAAQYLVETGVAKVLRIGVKEAVVPKKQEVDSVVIYSAPSTYWLQYAQVFYGSHGDTVVLGTDANNVAAALKAGSKKEGLVSLPKYANALKETDGSITIGVASLGATTELSFRALEMPPTRIYLKPQPGGPDKVVPLEQPKLSPRAEKDIKELGKIVDPLPPVVFSLTRKDDLLVFETRQSGLRTISVKLIDFWIEAAFQRSMEQATDRGIQGIREAVPDFKDVEKPVEKPKEKD